MTNDNAFPATAIPGQPLGAAADAPVPSPVFEPPDNPATPVIDQPSDPLPNIDQQPPIVNPSTDFTPPKEEMPKSDSLDYVDTTGAPRWEETQQAIKDLEKLTDSRVLVFYIGVFNTLTEEEVDYIYNHINTFNHPKRITLWLNGPGGQGIAAAKIVNLIRSYCDSFEVIVPQEAASAMTMLSLGAEKILMGPLSVITPIDTSIASHPLAPKDANNSPVRVEVTQIQKYIELLNSGMAAEKVDDIKKSPYALLSEHVHPLVIGTIQRSFSLSKMITSDILRTHLKDEEKIASIVNALNDMFPTHSYPINLKKAQELGIQAEQMPEELSEKTLKLLKIIKGLEKGSEYEKEGVKIKAERPVIIESIGMRSVWYLEKRFVMGDKKSWVRTSSDGRYIVMIPKRDEKGITRITRVDPSSL